MSSQFLVAGYGSVRLPQRFKYFFRGCFKIVQKSGSSFQWRYHCVSSKQLCILPSSHLKCEPLVKSIVGSGVHYTLLLEHVTHFLQHEGLMLVVRSKGVKYVIRMVIVWFMCMVRNNTIFKENVACDEAIVAQIKLLSWSWIMKRKPKNSSICFSDKDNNSLQYI